MAKGGTIKEYQERDKKAEYAYKFYLNKGYTPAQASGIVGNLLKESGLNPSAIGDSGKAFGLAQWHPDRQAKAKGLYGEKWKDFDNQLEFVHWELNNSEKSAGDKLKKVNSVWEAGKVFTDEYERPKVKFHADNQRQQFVTDIYRKHGKMELTDEDKNMFKSTFSKDVAPYMNQSTTPVTNFDIQIDSSKFASVPETPQKQETEKKEETKPIEKLKEQAFLEDYKSFYPEQEAVQQEQQDYQPIEQTDLEGIYNQVSAFVDQPAQQGGIIKDNNGYWNPNNWNKQVEISGGDITMKGVKVPLEGYSPETGERKLMLPNFDYNFPGAKRVIETPLKQNELAFLKALKNK